MRRRPALARALLLLLALVPVVWGTCPRWLAGLPCVPTPSEASCPCCGGTGDAGSPLKPDPYEPGSCPVLALRHTIAPAPAPCEVPAPDGVDVVWSALAIRARASVATPSAPPRLGTATAPDRVRGGAPPPRAGTVVLLI